MLYHDHGRQLARNSRPIDVTQKYEIKFMLPENSEIIKSVSIKRIVSRDRRLTRRNHAALIPGRRLDGGSAGVVVSDLNTQLDAWGRLQRSSSQLQATIPVDPVLSRSNACTASSLTVGISSLDHGDITPDNERVVVHEVLRFLQLCPHDRRWSTW